MENWNQFKKEMFSRQIEKEKEDILKFSDNVIEFVDYSVMEENLNVILIYGKIGILSTSKNFNVAYRMAVYPSFSMKPAFRDGNITETEMYCVDDVKKIAKAYFSHYIDKLK